MQSRGRVLLVSAAFLVMGSVGMAQSVTGSTTIELDQNTGMITATCETDLDGDAQEFYKAIVICTLTDGNGDTLAQDQYVDNYYAGYAQVVLTYQGTPGNIYFATGNHKAVVTLSQDYDEAHPWNNYYDDYYNFEAINELMESGYDYFPFVFEFYGPGPENSTKRNTIIIANTTDAVAYPQVGATVAVLGAGLTSQDDPNRTTYNGLTGTDQLGPLVGTFNVSEECRIGNQSVGYITPASSPGPFTLKRRLESAACFTGTDGKSHVSCLDANGSVITPGSDDTGTLISTNPVNGQVFNDDAPGTTFSAQTQNIIRTRFVFLDWVVGNDGKTAISGANRYYTRTSCHFNSNDVQPTGTADTQGDNSMGPGTTSLTWDLQ